MELERVRPCAFFERYKNTRFLLKFNRAAYQEKENGKGKNMGRADSVQF